MSKLFEQRRSELQNALPSRSNHTRARKRAGSQDEEKAAFRDSQLGALDAGLNLEGLNDQQRGDAIAEFVISSLSITRDEFDEKYAKKADATAAAIFSQVSVSRGGVETASSGHVTIQMPQENPLPYSGETDSTGSATIQAEIPFASYEDSGTIYVNGGNVFRTKGKNGAAGSLAAGINFTVTDGNTVGVGLTVTVSSGNVTTPVLASSAWTTGSGGNAWANSNTSSTVFAIPITEWSNSGGVYTCNPYHSGGIILPLYG